MLSWLSSLLWYAVAGFSAFAVCGGAFVWLRQRFASQRLYGTCPDGIAPKDPVAVADAFANIGRFHHERLDYESAVVLYNRVLDICPQAHNARVNRDRALERLSWSENASGAGNKDAAAPPVPVRVVTLPKQAPASRPPALPRKDVTTPQLSGLTMADATKDLPPLAPVAPVVSPAQSPPVKPAVRSDIAALLQQARKLLKNKEQDKAIELFNKIIEQDGDNAEALSGRGEAFLQNNRFNSAIRDFSSALRIYPQAGDVFNSRGIALSRSGRSKEAGQDFLAVARYAPALIGTHPAHADLILSQAMMHYKRDAFDKSLLHLDKLLNLTPGHVQARMYRGMAYDRKGMLDEAIKEFDLVLEAEPKLAEVCWRRGEVYMKKNLYRNALLDFNKALERDPLCPAAFYGLGRIAAGKGLHRDAIENFSKALAQQPGNGDILFARGLEWKMEGMVEQALADFQSACDHGRTDALAEYENLQKLQQQTAGIESGGLP